MPLDEKRQLLLVESFWRHYRMTSGNRKERLERGKTFSANDEVSQAALEGSDGIVKLLVALSEAVSDDPQALAYLGAGPLEDLLSHPSKKIIDEVDVAARRVPSFRFALQCAWFENSLPSDEVERLRRFGPRL